MWSHRRQPTRFRRPWESPGKNTLLGECKLPFSEPWASRARLGSASRGRWCRLRRRREAAVAAARAPAVARTPGSTRSPGGGHATHCSTLPWRLPWTEEPGGLQSLGSQRVRHSWVTARPVLLTTPRLRGGEGTGPPGSEMLWSRAGGLQELSPPYFSGFSKTAKIYIFFSPNPSCFIYVVSLSLSLFFFIFYDWEPAIFQKHVCVCISCSVVANSLRLHGLQTTRLLCPWDFPDKDTGVGCHVLLQWIFPTQGSNPGLLHCRQIL